MFSFTKSDQEFNKEKNNLLDKENTAREKEEKYLENSEINIYLNQSRDFNNIQICNQPYINPSIISKNERFALFNNCEENDIENSRFYDEVTQLNKDNCCFNSFNEIPVEELAILLFKKLEVPLNTDGEILIKELKYLHIIPSKMVRCFKLLMPNYKTKPALVFFNENNLQKVQNLKRNHMYHFKLLWIFNIISLSEGFVDIYFLIDILN
jgi:hypothetical protein